VKRLYIFILRFSFLYLYCFSLNAQAKDIVIGATLNLSGVNAQYSLDYKNAIQAYFESYNKIDKLKTYQLKLLVLDDQGVSSRAKDNIDRLITRKQVIAILNPYQGQIGQEIIQTAVKLNTLVLSSTFAAKSAAFTKAEKRYSYYFSSFDYFSHKVVSQLFDQLSNERLFYFNKEGVVERIITLNYQTEINIDKPLIDLPNGALIIIKESYSSAALFINESYKSRPDLNFIILPYIGAESVSTLIDKKAVKNIRFIVDTPLHLQLPLTKETNDILSKFSDHTMRNTQSLKGILSAKIIAKSVFNVINVLQGDSVADVIVFPFQVLERMVGWVKHSTSNLDRELIIDEIRNLKSFDVGLEQTISHENNGLGLNRLWLLDISEGQLVLRGNR